jgi:hypothetical protein
MQSAHLTLLYVVHLAYDFFYFVNIFGLYALLINKTGELSRYSDWLRAGRRRGRSSNPNKVKNDLFSTSCRLALGSTQPSTQWLPGALSPGVKRPGREADQSPPTNAEVNKMWIYTSTPPCVFMA